jgi:hypothetical protein
MMKIQKLQSQLGDIVLLRSQADMATEYRSLDSLRCQDIVQQKPEVHTRAAGLGTSLFAQP